MLKKYVAVSSMEMRLLLCSAVPDLDDVPPEGLVFRELPSGAYFPKGRFVSDPNNGDWLRKAKAMPPDGCLGFYATGRQNLLEWLLEKGYTLLPLDSHAFQLAFANRLLYEVVADWLTPEAFYSAERMAGEAQRAWEKTWPEGGFGWAVNWLRYDSHTMFAPFATAHLAAALVAPLREKASRLIVLRAPHTHYLSLTGGNDIAVRIWQDALAERTSTIHYDNVPPSLLAEEVVHPMERYAKLAGRALFNGVDWYRYRNAEQALARHTAYPSGILQNILLHSSIVRYTNALDSMFGIPLETLPITFRLQGEEEGARALHGSVQNIIPYGASLDSLFQTVCWSRFSTLDRAYRKLREIWTTYPPALCIGENIAAGERCLGLLVASELGIPAVGLPHSTLSVTKPATVAVPCDAVGHNSELLAAYDRVVTGGRPRSMSFVDTGMENSIITRMGQGFFPDGDGVKVLVLPEVVMLSADTLGIYLYPELLRRWVRTLQAVPPDLCSALTMRYKLHPAFNSAESFLTSIEGFSEGFFIDPQAALPCVLAETDVLICLEYTSSPLILGMRAKVPVVTCAAPEGQLSPNRSAVHLDIARAGVLVSSADDLWDALRPLVTDAQARRAVADRQTAFLRDQYLVARNGSIADYAAARIMAGRRNGKPA